MGLAASQGRLLMLHARKSDIEYRGQIVNNRRMILAFEAGRLADNYVHAIQNNTDIGVNSALYEAQSAALQAEDKRWELENQNLDTQHKAVETEIESVKKVIDKNIEKSFKVFA